MCRSQDPGRCWTSWRHVCEPCIAKEQKIEDLELFLKVLQTRYGILAVYCDEEECPRQIVHGTAERLGLPTGVTAVEQSQANERAQQRGGAEIILENFPVKSDVDLRGGGSTHITPHEAHTGHKAPSNVVGFLERVLHYLSSLVVKRF